MKYTVRSEKKHLVTIGRQSDFKGVVDIPVGKRSCGVVIRKTHPDGSLKTLKIDEKIYPVKVEKRADGFPSRVYLKGIPYDVDIERVESTRYRPPAPEKEIDGSIRATLPGQITAVLVELGQEVEAGQPLLILEAMKMENEVLAPKSGKVAAIFASKNHIVRKNEELLRVEDA